MDVPPASEEIAREAERALRAELARADAAHSAAGSLLRHLLVNEGGDGLTEETVARVRGMIADLARQLLAAQAANAEPEPDAQARLAALLTDDAALLAHVHALAFEAELAERRHARDGLDPVLTPLVQGLVASDNSETAALAMAVLAAQARFLQHSRRMELPLRELPGDLFLAALAALGAHCSEGEAERDEARHLRESYDEADGRLALLERLASNLPDPAAALDPDQAGVAIFASALAIAADESRDAIVLAAAGRQPARLALAMRAAGLAADSIEHAVLALHPEVSPPSGLGSVEREWARTALRDTRRREPV